MSASATQGGHNYCIRRLWHTVWCKKKYKVYWVFRGRGMSIFGFFCQA